MKNNRLRYLIVLVILIAILLLIIGVIVYFIRHRKPETIDYDSCPRPTRYETNYDFDYTKKPNEYRNLNSSIDYFRLTLSWSPTFCETNYQSKNSFQCQHTFGFIVHGLWPSAMTKGKGLNPIKSHPRNCRNEERMPLDLIRTYFCIMPSETLMQAEWEKHGTCYWQKPEEYFEQIKTLYSNIRIPNNINEILKSQVVSKRKAIQESFVNLNPQLKYDHVDVIMNKKGTKVKEVAFCYDHSFNYIACNRNM